MNSVSDVNPSSKRYKVEESSSDNNSVNWTDNKKDCCIMSWTNTQVPFLISLFNIIASKLDKIDEEKGFSEMIIKQSLEELDKII